MHWVVAAPWQLLSDADQDHHFQLKHDRQLWEFRNSTFTVLPLKAQGGITLFVWHSIEVDIHHGILLADFAWDNPYGITDIPEFFTCGI